MLHPSCRAGLVMSVTPVMHSGRAELLGPDQLEIQVVCVCNCAGGGQSDRKCMFVTDCMFVSVRVFVMVKKKKNFTSFGEPARLITCANHGNDVICA